MQLPNVFIFHYHILGITPGDTWCRESKPMANKSHIITLFDNDAVTDIARWSGDVTKKPGHKNVNAVSHKLARPEVLFSNSKHGGLWR